MSDEPDNVFSIDARRGASPSARPQTVECCVPDDSRDIVNLASDAHTGIASVVVLPAPQGMWELDDPDAVESLAVHMIHLAHEMRRRKGPP